MHRFAFLLVPVVLVVAGCVNRGPFSKPLEPHAAVGSPAFRQEVGALLDSNFGSGNRVTTLVNGDRIFPAMLRAIRSARKTITFETFVFENGEVPRLFVDALAERARAGVKVHIILDAHGAKKSREYRSTLTEAGAQLELFHPILWFDPRRYNNRTHRKLLVIDGAVGFIGGVGIADEWAGNADSPKHWRDTHYRVEGPAVAQLQAAFAANWLKTHNELLHGPDYFPDLPARGSVSGSVFYSSPRHGKLGVPILYELAISSARRTLFIENAYFVPSNDLVDALIAAVRRGVHVRIVVPGEHIDQKAVRRASKKRWARLLEDGVEIYEYQPTMIHCKLLIADGLFVSVGSANFDSRSLHLNDEANLNVLDAKFAAEQTRLFEGDRANSKRVTLENMKDKTPAGAPIEKPLESQL